jgi:DNA-binding NarL/FixJ family response regulator
MSEALNIVIFDAFTDETIEREMTVDEIADLQIAQAEAELLQQQHEAKSTARQNALAKLAALGLTQEEIEAL